MHMLKGIAQGNMEVCCYSSLGHVWKAVDEMV